MFGLGFTEVILTMVVVLLVFGPDRLPEIARNIGKVLGELRRVSDDFRRELNSATRLDQVDFDKLDRLTQGDAPKKYHEDNEVPTEQAPGDQIPFDQIPFDPGLPTVSCSQRAASSQASFQATDIQAPDMPPLDSKIPVDTSGLEPLPPEAFCPPPGENLVAAVEDGAKDKDKGRESEDRE